ncbi:MAG: hypothetical protein H0X49_04160 [Acidobacteria bacterium]|nr:hypothetical protein [Acidobacteriota bacterium]
MNTKTFNENFKIDRKSKGVKAMPKHATAEAVEIMTADSTAYDSTSTYYFFDAQTGEVRQSLGLRRDKDYLCAFGLKVVLIAELRASRDDSLTDGQTFFKSEIERLQDATRFWRGAIRNDKRPTNACGLCSVKTNGVVKITTHRTIQRTRGETA